ncbi:MAG: hypothetical protein EBT92_09595 [Planctomycetes bacterium]|nr:hypothetical protein [Planctomycetota bacterium]
MLKVKSYPARHPEIARPNLLAKDHENRQYFRVKTKVLSSHFALITTKNDPKDWSFFFSAV